MKMPRILQVANKSEGNTMGTGSPVFGFLVSLLLFSSISFSQFDPALQSSKSSNISADHKSNYDSPAQVLFDNGPIITMASGGCSGGSVSILDGSVGGHATSGWLIKSSTGNFIADDFSNIVQWNLDSIKFFAYQSLAASVTITGIYIQIWSGSPDAGGSVIWGDLTTNRLSTARLTNIYRALSTDPQNCDRRIQEVIANCSAVLPAGNYWVQWGMTGSLSAGPSQPPVTVSGQAITGNALYYSGGAWQQALNGTSPNGAPFIVYGTTGGSVAPGPPANPIPANNVTGISVNSHPYISWTNPSGVTFNKVYISANQNDVASYSPSALVFNGMPSSVSTTYNNSVSLLSNTDYYWRIVEFNANDSTAGEIWHFKTAGPSSLNPPANVSAVWSSLSNRVTVTWTNPATALNGGAAVIDSSIILRNETRIGKVDGASEIFIESNPPAGLHYYGVISWAGGVCSAPGISPPALVGLPDSAYLWRMQIKVTAGNSIDSENFAGVSDHATEGYDINFDLSEPPVTPGNYAAAYFYHPEWNIATGSYFSYDIKKNTVLIDTIKQWRFTVNTNVVNDTVKLEFVNHSTPSGYNKYLSDLITGETINLNNISYYKYYNTAAGTREFILSIGDSVPPAASITFPNGNEILRANTEKVIRWTYTGGNGIDSIFIDVSRDAGQTFSFLKKVGNIRETNWQTPPEYLNHNYSIRLRFRDLLGNITSVQSENAFTVAGDSLAAASPAGWSLYSLPLNPYSELNSSIFGDDIVSGPYSVWGYQQQTGYFISQVSSFGKGYWLGLQNNSNWDVRGLAVESDSVVFPLVPGYNLIGNPFVRAISLSNLYFKRNNTILNFNDAVTNGWITNTLYGYENNSYAPEDTLNLFGGYWLGVIQDAIQLIQKPVSIPAVTAVPEKISTDNWSLPIIAKSGMLSDKTPEIGIKPASTNGFDVRYDMPHPPRNPGDNYLELYFENSGAGFPQIFSNRYSKDFRDRTSMSWIFKVEFSQTGNIEILWDKNILDELGDSITLKLKDNVTNIVTDMKSDSVYSFSYNGVRSFTINKTLTGVNDNGIFISDYGLSQNYPNPFNPVTTISYSVAKAGNVRLTVYNTLGQVVSVLLDEYKLCGRYETEFDASGLNSGIYFYKLEAGEFVSVRKMVVMK